MSRYCRLYDLLLESVEPHKSALLIQANKPAVADDISSEYGGETAFHQNFPSPED